MAIRIFSSLSLLLVSQLALADLISVVPSGKQLEGMALAKSAVFHSPQGDKTLISIGAGVRKKTIFKVKVYVAELFGSEPSTYKYTPQDTQALNSLMDMDAQAIRLTFLRTVTSLQVRDSFLEALRENGIDWEKSPSIKEFMSKVLEGPAPAPRKSVILVADKNRKILAFQDPAGKVTEIKGDGEFLRNIFMIWLGTPADSGLEVLKTALTQSPT